MRLISSSWSRFASNTRSIAFQRTLAGMLLAAALGIAPGASAQDVVVIRPFAGDRFATLPTEANFPEGITADPTSGDLFVGTFDAPPDGTGTNFLLRFDRKGRLEAQLPLGPIPLTGLAFNPRDGKVYWARPGALAGADSSIQRVAANFDASTPVEDVAIVPNIGAPADRVEQSVDGQPIAIVFPDSVAFPNGLVFRSSDGTLFVTDSLQAAVFQLADPSLADNTCPTSSDCVQLTLQSPLLASATFPQLGVNGIEIAADGQTLLVTNTGDDRLLSLAEDGTLAVVTESLEGADGVVRGLDGTLIVSRALGDELAIIDPASGRILAEIGEFRGIRRDGSVRGLLFPGSIVRVGNQLFANNLALPLTGSPSEPEVDVTTYTIARIRLPRRLDTVDVAPLP